MYCKLNHNLDCDCCGTCMPKEEEQEEEQEVSTQCYICGNWIDKDEECYVILDKIICADCVDDAYFGTLVEALDEDAR